MTNLTDICKFLFLGSTNILGFIFIFLASLASGYWGVEFEYILVLFVAKQVICIFVESGQPVEASSVFTFILILYSYLGWYLGKKLRDNKDEE